MIALIAAVPQETELLRRDLCPCEVRTCGHRDLFLGTLCGQAVALLHSGVGKAGAAATTASLLERHHPTAVLVFGCGGAYPGNALGLRDLALATDELYGDEGVLTPDGFRDLETLGFPLVQRGDLRLFNRFPTDPTLLANALSLIAPTAAGYGRKVATGTFVTVSTCSGTDVRARELAARTEGLCENMEGAAVAQICHLYEIPFLEIRGISNFTEDRDLSRWDLKGGAEMAQRAVKALLAGWGVEKDLA